MILDRLIFRSHLHPAEKLLYVAHQHWFAIYRSVVKIGFFGLLIPVVLWLMFPPGFWVFVVWFALAFLRFLYEVINWYLDAILITSEGITYLDWRGFFDKSSQRVEFDTVIGVIYDKNGFWANIFNFGLLTMDKGGGEEERIFLSRAADPAEVEQQFLLAKENHAREHALESEKALKEILSGMVADHVRKERQDSKLADML